MISISLLIRQKKSVRLLINILFNVVQFMQNPQYSVVIPVYNSSKSLIELIPKIKQVFENSIRESYEIILVNDSPNNEQTRKTLDKLNTKFESLIIIELFRNFGRPGALLAGFKESRGDYIIMMDDDLEHPPEVIPKLIENQGHDIVIAYFSKKTHNIFRRIVSKIKGWFDYKLLGKPKHIKNSGFKLINRKIIDAVNKLHTPNPFISALLFYVSRDIVNVEIPHGRRKYGKSGYSFVKLLSQFSNLLFNNSSFMLKIIFYIGIFFFFISIVLITYFIYLRFIKEEVVAGWTSLIVLELFFGGLILFSLGIIGEYLIRIISVTEKRPAYIIKEKTS
ncbi:glycosyltransferase [Candidatus Dojkabacteria bacterium]|nr:glycosyltransferase [Candidatus Dojkabacteria bacterium]